MNPLVLGLATGAIFGFLLQRGRVLRFERQVGAMRLRDMTIVKFMLSSILVGMIGLHWLAARGVIAFQHKTLNWGALLVGGVLFGSGWALAGFCPGTAVGALGEGRWHALWVVLGMVAGAAVYAEAYPFLERTVLSWSDAGGVDLPGRLGWSPWPVIGLLILLSAGLFAFFERRKI